MLWLPASLPAPSPLAPCCSCRQPALGASPWRLLSTSKPQLHPHLALSSTWQPSRPACVMVLRLLLPGGPIRRCPGARIHPLLGLPRPSTAACPAGVRGAPHRLRHGHLHHAPAETDCQGAAGRRRHHALPRVQVRGPRPLGEHLLRLTPCLPARLHPRRQGFLHRPIARLGWTAQEVLWTQRSRLPSGTTCVPTLPGFGLPGCCLQHVCQPALCLQRPGAERAG